MCDDRLCNQILRWFSKKGSHPRSGKCARSRPITARRQSCAVCVNVLRGFAQHKNRTVGHALALAISVHGAVANDGGDDEAAGADNVDAGDNVDAAGDEEDAEDAARDDDDDVGDAAVVWRKGMTVYSWDEDKQKRCGDVRYWDVTKGKVMRRTSKREPKNRWWVAFPEGNFIVYPTKMFRTETQAWNDLDNCM